MILLIICRFQGYEGNNNSGSETFHYSTIKCMTISVNQKKTQREQLIMKCACEK